MIPSLVAAVLLLAPASAGAGVTRPPVSLVASPAHVSLTGAARRVVTVTSTGSERVVLEAFKAGYGLDLRGRPRILLRRRSWISVRPRRVALAPGRQATLVVASIPPVRAEPGDHSELVLLTTHRLRTASLSVRMRLGLVVVVRVPGRIVRRLEALRVRVRPRRLELLVANRGNVTETVARRCVTVTVRRASRVLARLHPAPRTLLPHTTGLLDVRFRPPKRGRLSIHVAVSPGPACRPARLRTFAVRLR